MKLPTKDGTSSRLSATASDVSITSLPSHISGHSIASARIVVPHLLHYVNAASVVDFGCKHGEWLSVFREQGVSNLLGLDLEVRLGLTLLESHEFKVADLRKPIGIPNRFDLAVCIEVAEHLPPKSAEPLVRGLTGAAPVVMFSAAVPHQGGWGHLNEQPRAYWKALFAERGYRWLDCIRPHIWQCPRVAWWYRQNLFLYANDEAITGSAALMDESRREVADDVDLLHPMIVQRHSLRFRARKLVTERVARKLTHDRRPGDVGKE